MWRADRQRNHQSHGVPSAGIWSRRHTMRQDTVRGQAHVIRTANVIQHQ